MEGARWFRGCQANAASTFMEAPLYEYVSLVVAHGVWALLDSGMMPKWVPLETGLITQFLAKDQHM